MVTQRNKLGSSHDTRRTATDHGNRRFYRVVQTVGGDVQEVQAITHDHTGGTLTLSYDGEGPTAAIDWDAPVLSVAAAAELTIAVKPVAAVAAEGLLTIDIKPINGDTLTIDTDVYTFQTTLTNVANNVAIGATLATAQENLVAAVARSAGYGTKYAAATAQHPTVTMSAFATDDATLTARTAGAAGDAIVTTETFDGVTNIFDATTLGGVTTGINGDTVTIDAVVYTYVDVLTGAANEVAIGATLTTAQDNLVEAIDSNPTATAAAFAANLCVITVNTPGTAGNAVDSLETFASGSNVFDATTFGTEVLGVNGVKTELELFTNISTVAVVRNGNGDWDVTFPSADGDVATITIADGSLTGGTTSGVVSSPTGVDATFTYFAVATHFDANK